MFEESLLETAVSLAKQGHTHGKIVQELRAVGLDTTSAKRLAHRALKVASRGDRIKTRILLAIGGVLSIYGLTMIFAAWNGKPVDGLEYATPMAGFGIFLVLASYILRSGQS